jgi:RNA recognition motif-containing protein
MKKLFVGNLAWQTTEEDLRQLFSQYGNILSVKVVLDQYTGRSKGFGFVEFETAEEANAAIEGLNEKPFHDRNIRVSQAQDRPSEGRGGGGGGGRPGGDRGDRGDRGGFRRSSGGPNRSSRQYG